jgi:DNA primase
MRYQNISFGEALKLLADRYHITLPEPSAGRRGSDRASETLRKEQDDLLRVVEAATEFFNRQLNHEKTGKAAREYLRGRAIPQRVVETERLGYAPASWDGLVKYLRSVGMDPELGVRAGLLAKGGSDQSRIYDRFRNRVIFPIRDERNRVVAFGGRILPGGSSDEPKYLNSPESPVYFKGRMLYQMARAREACRDIRQVVLVEGYMDLLAFHARDFHRVTATLGTALTPHQARLLARFAGEVVLGYDSDEAGEKAMMRALPLLLQEEVPVSCVRFPEGMDPDDYLRREGIEGFERLIDRREDLGAYAIRKALGGWDGTIAGKTRVVTEIQPLFGAIRQPVLRAEYVRLLADRLSLPEEAIEKQLRMGVPERQGRPAATASPGFGSGRAFEDIRTLEENIVKVMIKYPEFIDEVVKSEAIGHFRQTGLKSIAEAIARSTAGAAPSQGVREAYDLIEDEKERELFARLMLDAIELEQPEVYIGDWLGALKARALGNERQDLRQELDRLGGAELDRSKELLEQIRNKRLLAERPERRK